MSSANSRFAGYDLGSGHEPQADEIVTVGCVRNGFHVDNSAFVKKNFNTNKTYGGRAALKIDLDDNWTVTPTIMHQNVKYQGRLVHE